MKQTWSINFLSETEKKPAYFSKHGQFKFSSEIEKIILFRLNIAITTTT